MLLLYGRSLLSSSSLKFGHKENGELNAAAIRCAGSSIDHFIGDVVGTKDHEQVGFCFNDPRSSRKRRSKDKTEPYQTQTKQFISRWSIGSHPAV